MSRPTIRTIGKGLLALSLFTAPAVQAAVYDSQSVQDPLMIDDQAQNAITPQAEALMPLAETAPGQPVMPPQPQAHVPTAPQPAAQQNVIYNFQTQPDASNTPGMARTTTAPQQPASSASAPAPTYDMQSSPLAAQPQQQGEATFITGGVGAEDREQLQAAKREYNLHVLNAETTGAYVDGVQITVRDSKGREIFNTEAGPLLYAKLPSGKYTVESVNNGVAQKRSVTVASGRSTNANFSWK